MRKRARDGEREREIELVSEQTSKRTSECLKFGMDIGLRSHQNGIMHVQCAYCALAGCCCSCGNHVLDHFCQLFEN